MTFNDDEFEDYTDEYDSNEAYREALQRIKQGHRVDNGYMPSPLEIALRRADLLWLQQLGFGERFIQTSMQHESPSMHHIRRLIKEGMDIRAIERRFAKLLE